GAVLHRFGGGRQGRVGGDGRRRGRRARFAGLGRGRGAVGQGATRRRAGRRQLELHRDGTFVEVRGQLFDAGGEILADPVQLETVGSRNTQHPGFVVEVERDQWTYPRAYLLGGKLLFQFLDAGLPEFIHRSSLQ